MPKRTAAGDLAATRRQLHEERSLLTQVPKELKPTGQEQTIEYQFQPFLKYRLAFTFGLPKVNIDLGI